MRKGKIIALLVAVLLVVLGAALGVGAALLGDLTLDDKPGIVPDTAQVVADAHSTLKG